MSQDNFFNLYPVRNPKIRWENKPDKLTLIFVRDSFRDKILSNIFKTPKIIQVELDEMSSVAWQHCDGQKRVYQIVNEMRRVFGEIGEPAPERMLVFLRTLRERGWIKISKEAVNAD